MCHVNQINRLQHKATSSSNTWKHSVSNTPWKKMVWVSTVKSISKAFTDTVSYSFIRNTAKYTGSEQKDCTSVIGFLGGSGHLADMRQHLENIRKTPQEKAPSLNGLIFKGHEKIQWLQESVLSLICVPLTHLGQLLVSEDYLKIKTLLGKHLNTSEL